MILSGFCPPAIIYLIFSLTHVLVATFEEKHNKALLELLLCVLVVLLLQYLCVKGMSLISWIIVFIPFIFYTYMVLIIHHVFGLNPGEGDTSKEYLVN